MVNDQGEGEGQWDLKPGSSALVMAIQIHRSLSGPETGVRVRHAA